MHDTPIEPMNAQNVEEFDVWIFDSLDRIRQTNPPCYRVSFGDALEL